MTYLDVCQMSRVFSNLIDNAVRHNPPGTTITLYAEPITVKQYAMLKVYVTDNGRGCSISPQHSGFEPYVRGADVKYQPGLGLGLYICQQVIQAHGGEIGIEHHSGTAVWFTLPR